MMFLPFALLSTFYISPALFFASRKIGAIGFEPTAPSQISPENEQNAGQAAQIQAHFPPIDSDLQTVIDGWADLPAAIKAGILAMVKAATGGP